MCVCVTCGLLSLQDQTVRQISTNVPPIPASTRGRASTMSQGTSATVSCLTPVWKYYSIYVILQPYLILVFWNVLLGYRGGEGGRGHFPHTVLLKELAKRKNVPLMKQLSSKVQLQDFLRLQTLGFHLLLCDREASPTWAGKWFHVMSKYYFNKQAVIDGLTADFLEFFLMVFARKKKNPPTWL